jgi:polysaccharide biosynthesis protein VpsM
LTPKRIGLLVTGALWASLAYGQTATPGVPGTPASPVTTGAVPPAQPTATGLIRGNPATPQPLPDLADNMALPAQRGFIRAEPVFIYPSLGVGLGYDDNLTSVHDNRISSAFVMLFPRVRADIKKGSDTYAVTYNGRYGHYFRDSDNDINEHEVVATSNNQFTARADLAATAFYLVRQDQAGSVDRPFTGTPDRWHGAGAFATFGYGAPSAQGRVEIDAAATDKRYENNRDVTEAFDVSTWNLGTRFLYRVAPKTRLLAEVRYTDYDYRSSPLDNAEQRYLVGATWDATAATSGTLKLGYIRKDFKQEEFGDHAGFTAEAAVRWLPRTYSTVEIVARYAPSDSTGTGVFTVDKSIGARWDHYWKSYLMTRVAASYVKSDFKGASRTDDYSRIGVASYFDIRTWLRLGLELSHENRNSSDATADFSRNVVLLTIGGTL